MDFVVARYGEFVLLKPSFSRQNLILWGAPFALALIGVLVMFAANRRRGAALNPSGLSVEEQRQLDEIIGEEKSS